MRRRWSVGPDCKSGALRGLAGSNPAIPTEERRLKNKHTGALEHLNTSHSLFLLLLILEEFSERLPGTGRGLENRSLARGVGSNPTSSAKQNPSASEDIGDFRIIPKLHVENEEGIPISTIGRFCFELNLHPIRINFINPISNPSANEGLLYACHPDPSGGISSCFSNRRDMIFFPQGDGSAALTMTP